MRVYTTRAHAKSVTLAPLINKILVAFFLQDFLLVSVWWALKSIELQEWTKKQKKWDKAWLHTRDKAHVWDDGSAIRNRAFVWVQFKQCITIYNAKPY